MELSHCGCCVEFKGVKYRECDRLAGFGLLCGLIYVESV